MGQKELPIFFDQTGKRWRKTKWVFGVSFVSFAGALSVLFPALTAPAYPREPAGGDIPEVRELTEVFNTRNTPVLGQGQFVQAVEIKKRENWPAAFDVFDGGFVRALTSQEAVEAGSHRYALLRYGQLPDKQIALTFDDGPDPAYTPRMLNVLSKHKVQATFFVVGSNVVKHPEIAKRLTREGHVAANHTFSHIDFDYRGTIQGEQEINQTARVLTVATGHRSAMMRVPYSGSTDQSLRDQTKGILQAQRLGYVPVSYDYDTRDWSFKSDRAPDPSIFDGKGKILLLHDAGGDRSHTVNYVDRLIPMAREAGYTFVNLNHLPPGSQLYGPAEPSAADEAAFAIGRAVLVLPPDLILVLFAVNVGLIFVVTGTNIALAVLHKRRSRRPPKIPRSYRPRVSVVVPAYNEAAVLEGSVRSVLASRYKNLDVVIVDDGSSDDTYRVARKLASRSRRVKALHQRNRGKAAALNKGIRNSKGEIVICIDADTIFTASTVWRLVRHFHDPKVGAVAGYVRAGNVRNWLTRWQAMEFIIGITLERSAQSYMNAVMVVPGACGAWRREALAKAGNFSARTLAEDCDVALSVRRDGYIIKQDSTAVSYTECPLTLGDLAKQRFRWIFGNIQSYWKHRRMFFNKQYGLLGMFVLPNAAATILLPMLFWPLLVGLTITNLAAGRWWVIATFLAVIMALQFLIAGVALALAREKFSFILAVPMTRLVYGPLRIYILYRSLLTVLRGALVSWNKVSRTRTVRAPGHAPAFRAIQRPAEE